MDKLRVCLYNLTGCEGCSLKIIEVLVEEGFLKENIEVHGHLIDTDEVLYCDIAFIDGLVATEHDIELVKEIRRRSRYIVAVGACANIAGLLALIDSLGLSKGIEYVYKTRLNVKHFSKPIKLDDVVRVDYRLYGCPPQSNEIKQLITSIMMGKSFRQPDSPVCRECRELGLPCLLKEGKPCLGPVTRAGCRALCIRYGMPCWGCRGLFDEARYDKLLELYRENNIDKQLLVDTLKLFLSRSSLVQQVIESK